MKLEREKKVRNNMTLGNRIKKLRKELNLSQKELADKLYVTDKALSSWENGRTEPDIDTLLKMSEIFNCNISYLIKGYTKRNDIETEIKIELSKKEYLNLKALFKNRIKYITEILQNDSYYKLLKSDCYLRIRTAGNKNIVTYKEYHKNYCDEFEVEIDDVKSMVKIFAGLGLKQHVMLEKKRIVYSYLNKYEIVLDNVKNLGYFVEIEIKKYDFDKLEEYQKLLQVAKDFGLNLAKKTDKHYLGYILEKDNELSKNSRKIN